MEAVSGSILSTTLGVVRNRIALNKNFLVGLFPENKKLQLKRLERVLQIVSPVLQDAENKQDKSPAVRSWFDSLKHAVYQADNVLDEIDTHRLTGNQLSIRQSFADSYDQLIGELSARLEEIFITWNINSFPPSRANLIDTHAQYFAGLSKRQEEIFDAKFMIMLHHPSRANLINTDAQFIADLSQLIHEIYHTWNINFFQPIIYFDDQFFASLSRSLYEQIITQNDTDFGGQLIAECLYKEFVALKISALQYYTGNLIDTDFRDQFNGELSQRLEEICDALERKVQQIGKLGLAILYGKQKREDKAPSTSVVEQSQICGRDDEKEKIIQMVLSGEGGTDISVIPITGMGGIGKTTLAQLVYNDERVKNHFEKRAWACVSEEFDVYRVTKDLLMEVNSSLVNDNDDLNRLQVKLTANLEQRRFIIILDDIWSDNFNDYQRLMTPLKSGSRGSKIIVTTRNEKIALILQNEPFQRLKPLSDDQSWSLFKLHAFDNKARTVSHEFVTIGKTVAERCKGLPLAIKIVAGALRSKKDIREWRDILSNDNWMAEGDILPALSLSYKLLPSHLKCCFAFCAVLPKDVPFNKEDVALLWMANDLVSPSGQRVAENYFEELRSRSFFEMGNKYFSEIGSRSYYENDDNNLYVMHDLINDLARHVSGSFCARMEDCQINDVHQGIQVKYDLPPEVLHCSYLNSDDDDDTLERLRGLAQAQGLRTFLLSARSWAGHGLGDITEILSTYILPKLRHIRALSLLRFIREIPDSIGDLKQLRLLNLAGNGIKKLPDDITKCLNLQTLILAGCLELEELPKHMGLLFNLQTLILSSCIRLKELPEDMSSLTNLQTLKLKSCWMLKELPEDMGRLTNLQHLDVRDVRLQIIDKIWLSELKDIPNLSIVAYTIPDSALEQFDKSKVAEFLVINRLYNAVTVEKARQEMLNS